MGRAALHVPLRAGTDARGEAVGDGEWEGDGRRRRGEGGGARRRRVGITERRRGRQRVVRAGAQTGVRRWVAGVRGAGRVLGEARLGIGALCGERGSVRFHLKLEQVKVV